MIKKEIRIIAWDDCAFSFNSDEVTLIGAIFRGGSFLDGMLSTTIEKDGMDATEKISNSVTKSRNYDQLSIIMLDGISYGGLNLVDIQKLHRKTKLPVIVFLRKKPDFDKFLKALERTGGNKRIVESAGVVNKMEINGKDIFYQKAGISEEDCKRIFKLTCVRSNVPEPLRVAHIIASGLSGESRGRA